jgi:hypothetical protein
MVKSNRLVSGGRGMGLSAFLNLTYLFIFVYLK